MRHFTEEDVRRLLPMDEAVKAMLWRLPRRVLLRRT